MHSIAVVTGAYGFIGRHLSRYLSQNGYRVAGIGHGNWSEDEALQWGVSFWVDSDIDAAGLDHIKRRVGAPNEIYHIAGGSSVGRAIENPLMDFKRTVDSTSTLMDWVFKNSPEAKTILASSAAVYGSGHLSPIKESSELNPYSPYGYHKRIAELILKSYSESYGLETAIVRLFSVYGPGLYKQILWDTLQKLKAGPSQLELFGTGQEKRDFLHIQDAVLLLKLAAQTATKENFIFNGGTGTASSISHLAKILCQTYGVDVPIVFNGKNRPGDPAYLVAETSFSSSFGFCPLESLESGVQDYVSWFQELKL